MTARDGIGRPTPSSDLHDDAPTTIDPAVEGSAANGATGNGGPRYSAGAEQVARGSHATAKASTAYEVAAALRAQASRAAQATREAGRRVQDALNTQPDPGAVVANTTAKPTDTPTAAAAVVAAAATAPAHPRHAPVSGAAPSSAAGSAAVGAAAAMAATARTAPPSSRESELLSSAYPTESQTAPANAAGVETSVDQPPAVQAESGLAPEHHPAQARAGVDPGPEYRSHLDLAGRQVVEAAPAADLHDSALAPAPEADPLAPVVVPSSDPVPRETGVVEPAPTHVSLEAGPAATQLAPQPIPVPPPAPSARRGGRVRKARLRLLRVDPWSVMKTAFLLSVALGITLFVAVAVLWSVLDAAGVFTAVGDLVADLTTAEGNPESAFRLENYTALSRVLGFTTLIAVVDVVLVTALATLGAFLYNLSANLLGGLEVTLAEDD
ncbi:MAG TPA: DUF3566 domain-containing protein [Jiangellaceae bacterium]|nr:DUF3566 domain-containing protein [Jiangellaceae bacterium]